MKKLAIYFSLMEENNKLQNLFLFMNVVLFLITLISLILTIIFSIPNVVFIFSGLFAILFLVLQSDFILNICKNYANKEFKKLYLKHLKVETYHRTEKECKNFRKIRQNILIAYMRNNRRSLQKGFAYLKEWQSENVMMYEF